ncbi:MAG: cyclic nucleotide-binding domain-containing protein [Magnetococcales bacterium]|nr:cyclic nucleotide-binding domain-containing protein [Magnetococcales bacterium]
MQPEITLEALVKFIKKIQGFEILSHGEIKQHIAPIISISMYAPGQLILKQGDEGKSVFFLYSGHARANVHVNSETTLHNDMKEGGIFGELALVTNEKRSADVVAVSDVCCLSIDIETFQKVMLNNWKITKAIAILIGNRRVKQLPGY